MTSYDGYNIQLLMLLIQASLVTAAAGSRGGWGGEFNRKKHKGGRRRGIFITYFGMGAQAVWYNIFWNGIS